MKRSLLYTILTVSLTLFVTAGCNNFGRKPKTNQENKSSKTIQKSPYNRAKKLDSKAVPVIVGVAKPGNITRYIFTNGTAQGITDITMKSQVNGTVEEVYKDLGEWVNKGDSIGKIDNTEYDAQFKQAKANLMAAGASYKSVKLQMKAAERLYKQKAISENEYISAQSNLQKAEAAVNGAEASLEIAQKNYNNSQFISPVDGYITDFSLKIGENISTGSPVCHIVNPKKLIINTGVGETDIMYLHEGQTVELDYREMVKKAGKIIGVGIKKKDNTATYPVKIELDNSDGKLYPGMIVECKIYTQTYKDVFYTSEDNLVRELDQTYLYIVTKDNKAKKVPVTLGEVIGENVIIKSGIERGMYIVTDGIENLSDGTQVEIKITR